LQVASQAISVLSGDEDENIKNNFEELTVQYLELVNVRYIENIITLLIVYFIIKLYLIIRFE